MHELHLRMGNAPSTGGWARCPGKQLDGNDVLAVVTTRLRITLGN